MAEETEYVSVDAGAGELGVSRATMWKWVKRHDLETFRFMGDRKTYLRRADLARMREPVPVALQSKSAA